eukprot:m.126946 g.126946  ORF g.126946 m.126946 type:complete len:256 (+) comp29230_c0_seq1:109-876(+)
MESKNMNNAKTLCVWDFDWSLVNENTDDHVPLLAHPEMHAKLSAEFHNNRDKWKGQWTQFMNSCFNQLHNTGVTKQDFERCLKQVPVDADMLEAAKLASSHNCSVKIVSDANTFFIDTILPHHGLETVFDQIITNTARFERPDNVDDPGPLRVDPFVPTDKPHGCQRCTSVNMCKGSIINELIITNNYDRVFYVGDGSNDFCAGVNLRACDFILARKDFSLHKQLVKDSESLVCSKFIWSNGKEVFDFLKQNLEI